MFIKYNVIRSILITYYTLCESDHVTFIDDDTSPMHYKELESKDGEANYTLSYSSKNYGYYGMINVEMTVRVFVPWIPWISRKEIGFDKINYRITKSLVGHINVTQPNRTIRFDGANAIVSTLNTTTLEVIFHDPHGKIVSIQSY